MRWWLCVHPILKKGLGVIKLRAMGWNDIINETPIHDLRVIWEGNSQDAKRYAENSGFTWKVSKRYIFGGYWVNKTSGEVMYPT